MSDDSRIDAQPGVLGGGRPGGSTAPAAEDQEPREDAGTTTLGQTTKPATVAPIQVSSGQFHAVAHPGASGAIVYHLEDGSYALRLENLDIFNGPALYVYAVAADDANDNATVLEAGLGYVAKQRRGPEHSKRFRRLASSLLL